MAKFVPARLCTEKSISALYLYIFSSVLLRAIFIFLRNKHSTHIPVMQYFQYIFLFSMFFHKIYCFDLYICYIFHYIARICTQRFEL